MLGPKRKILALAIFISCFLCQFHLGLEANANPVSSGIWANILVISGPISKWFSPLYSECPNENNIKKKKNSRPPG